MKGWVGFTRARKPSWIGRAIEYFSHGKWTHTFVILGCDAEVGRTLIAEAGKWEVLITAIDKYLKRGTVVKFYKPKASEDQVLAGLARVLALLEQPYGYLELLGFVPIWFWKKMTGKEAPNPFGGGVVCSELALEYVQGVGTDPGRFKNLDRNSVSPVLLERLMSQSPAWSPWLVPSE